MSKSAHVLKIKKGNNTYTCDLYTTKAEARNNYFTVNKGNENLYAALSTVLNDLVNETTPAMVKKSGENTQYCIAQKSFFTITITPVAHETITVLPNDENYASATTGVLRLPYNSSFTVDLVGDEGYSPGTLSVTQGTLTNQDVTVTATAPSLKTYTLKLKATSHQTITLKYKNRNAANTGFEAEQTVTSTGSDQSFTVRHFSTWTATISVDTGWNVGTLSGSSGTISSNTEVSATAATHKTYVLTLGATSHQTITLNYKNHNGTSLASSWSTDTSGGSAKTHTLGHGSKYKASIAASSGYTAGALKRGSNAMTAGTEYELTGAITVKADAASAITPTITFTRSGSYTSFTVTYTNTAGNSVTSGTNPSSVTIKYNTGVKINNTMENTYYYDYYLSITQGNTYQTSITGGGNWTSGGLKGNTTFSLASSAEYTGSGGSSGEGSGGEGGDGGDSGGDGGHGGGGGDF